MPVKSNDRMPTCACARDIDPLLEAVERLRGRNRDLAWDFVDQLGEEGFCRLLHGIRRWYTYNSWNAAKKVLSARSALKEVMDLSPPVGAYRGFKVDRKSDLADLEPGDRIRLEVTRNRGCSSWTLRRGVANRFFGSDEGQGGSGHSARVRSGRSGLSRAAEPDAAMV